MAAPTLPEVYSAEELAAASHTPAWAIRELIATADIPTVDGALVAEADALAALRGLRSGRLRAHRSGARPGVLGGALVRRHSADRHSGGPAVLSTVLHAGVVFVVGFLTSVDLTTASDMTPGEPPALARLVFIAEPGPGGGGGGGGLRMPEPPPSAKREGTRPVSSPVPERIPPRRVEPVTAPEPNPLDTDALPQIFAPLMAFAADPIDVSGLLDRKSPEGVDSQGPGLDGGVGDGGGTGVGAGQGSGLGPGSGGGTGGGPYRPGSGVTPPRLVHEERPRYTEEARRRGITGDVLLEIVVRRDGTVGDVRVLRRLGAGLDEEAIRAIRLWRFQPAERLGAPVDVAVEVAVEFNLR